MIEQIAISARVLDILNKAALGDGDMIEIHTIHNGKWDLNVRDIRSLCRAAEIRALKEKP